MKKPLVALALCLASVAAAFGEVQEINGVRYICTEDGICRPVEEVEETPSAPSPEMRLAHGYMDAERFVAFLDGEAPEAGMLEGKGMWLVLLLVLLGGLAMNLTPCVLPMVPINLMVIGKSAARGVWYGAGIAVAYGVLGVLAAVGGMAFGEIQSSAWFNGAVAVVFLVLALALFDVFFIDLSKFRKVEGAAEKRARAPLVFAFSMGALSAVLAGACVAPILISVLILTADLFAKGNWLALGLPFVMGVGMALPWPFAGAGMQVLPKPGAWMKKVNKAFGVVVLGFAAWYAYLSVAAATERISDSRSQISDAGEGRQVLDAGDGSQVSDAGESSAGRRYLEATPATFEKVLAGAERPVLVDCWASWCKNCAAMERGTLRDPRVVEALEDFTVIRLQAEDIRALKSLKGFEGVRGLPAFLVIE